jgi:nitrite reductase (NO-forming)
MMAPAEATIVSVTGPDDREDRDDRARSGRAGASGPPRRVAIVHRQTRPTLALAVVFALAAAVASVVPHRTGAWLPLHLFLVGSLLLAISGATQLFAVTWAAGPPASARAAGVQRALIAVGAAGIAAARELSWPDAAIGTAAACVVAGLVVLTVLLVRTVRGAVQRRFDAALRTYVVALAAGVVGSALGAAMAIASGDWYDRVRNAHLTLNLFGLVGLVIAGTVPFFVATEARVKLSPRASARAAETALAVMTVSLVVGAAGVRAALAGYVIGLALVARLFPSWGRKQLRWAGPRLLQLYAGFAWWAVAALWIAARGFTERPVLALVIGAYAQILVASLAYLGPVLRGGGHERLSAGFRLTRSWESLVLLNVAAVAAAVGAVPLAAALAIAAGVSLAGRAVALVAR